MKPSFEELRLTNNRCLMEFYVIFHFNDRLLDVRPINKFIKFIVRTMFFSFLLFFHWAWAPTRMVAFDGDTRRGANPRSGTFLFWARAQHQRRLLCVRNVLCGLPRICHITCGSVCFALHPKNDRICMHHMLVSCSPCRPMPMPMPIDC